MQFKFRHWNRVTYPTKHVLICEDNLANQIIIAQHLLTMFPPEGHVQFSFVPGGLAAAAVLQHCKVSLILLDHDMPEGNGADLIEWMKKFSVHVPIVTFSGIPQNNDIMMALGAHHNFQKCDVMGGKADGIILGYTNNEIK